jgi:hypothetical protein
MIRIAIFTEGQSELIFVRTLLLKVIDNNTLSFQCIKLHGGREFAVRYNYSSPDPNVHFLIVNAENDNRVLSAIKEREKNLFKKGYHKIIGLRDMYSEDYYKRSPKVIDDKLTQEYIRAAMNIINTMSKPNKIKFCFAIMEIEAWFLSMYDLFSKINDTLSIDYIKTKLDIDLKEIDPQKEFYKPSNKIDKIFKLIGLEYNKSEKDCEKICSIMEITDFDVAIENDRCSTFKDFYGEIKGMDTKYSK